MSLDDRLNPNDGSFIDGIDSAIFEFNKQVAKKWCDKMYLHKDDLERVLYFGSAAAFSAYALDTHDFVLLAGVANSTFLGISKSARPKSARHEELHCEARGLPAKTSKYVDVIAYSLGAGSALLGIGYTAAGMLLGNGEWYTDSIRLLTGGLGFFCWKSADYMAKSDVGTPPPKPIPRPAPA